MSTESKTATCPRCGIPLHCVVEENQPCYCPVCKENIVRQGNDFYSIGSGVYDWCGRHGFMVG